MSGHVIDFAYVIERTCQIYQTLSLRILYLIDVAGYFLYFLVLESGLEHGKTSYLLDQNNATCFGVEDAEMAYSRVLLESLLIGQVLLKINTKNINDCEEFQRQVILSTDYRGYECNLYKQCVLLNDQASPNACTLKCDCTNSPCKINVLFLPMSEAKICQIAVV